MAYCLLVRLPPFAYPALALPALLGAESSIESRASAASISDCVGFLLEAGGRFWSFSPRVIAEMREEMDAEGGMRMKGTVSTLTPHCFEFEEMRTLWDACSGVALRAA